MYTDKDLGIRPIKDGNLEGKKWDEWETKKAGTESYFDSVLLLLFKVHLI